MTLDIKTIEPGFAVAPQIAASDAEAIKAAGFNAVICNRPDGEAADQPAYAEIEAAAQAAGLTIRWQPVVSSQMTVEDGVAFGKLLEELEGPVLAFCRSGTRSTYLWAIAQSSTRKPQELVRLAARAGYDVTGLFR